MSSPRLFRARRRNGGSSQTARDVRWEVATGLSALIGAGNLTLEDVEYAEKTLRETREGKEV